MNCVLGSHTSGLDHKLYTTAFLKKRVEIGRLIDCLPDCDQSVVYQDHCFVVAESPGDASTLVGLESYAAVVSINGVRLVEVADVLANHIKLAPGRGPGFPVHGMSMADGVRIWASKMACCMDGDSSCVGRN